MKWACKCNVVHKVLTPLKIKNKFILCKVHDKVVTPCGLCNFHCFSVHGRENPHNLLNLKFSPTNILTPMETHTQLTLPSILANSKTMKTNTV